MLNKKAQSILEYTLVLGGIIAVVALLMFNKTFGVKKRAEDVYNRTSTAINQTQAEAEGKGIFSFVPEE